MTAVVRQADAGAALRRLPPASIRLLITDPPYRTLDRGQREIKIYANGLGFRTLGWSTIASHLAIARRRLRPDGVAMLLVNRTSAPHARAALRAAGFARLASITWLNGVKLGGDPRDFVRGRRPPPKARRRRGRAHA